MDIVYVTIQVGGQGVGQVGAVFSREADAKDHAEKCSTNGRKWSYVKRRITREV